MEIKRKNSVKRQAILDALCRSHEHPTAEQLYETLKPEFPDLSLGTVYRNLTVFCQEGKARSVCHVAGKERFDGRVDDHSHFICRKCSRVLDIDLPQSIDSCYAKISARYGFHPEGHALVFTGLCNQCAADNSFDFIELSDQ